MANEEQLSILKQGVEVWNKWRAEERPKMIDLGDANLHRANLVGANLNKADLGDADLFQANLNKAHLCEAQLGGASLFGANLSETNLSRANLYRADLMRADLRDANLNEADLSGANLFGARLSRANLSKAELNQADLGDASLVEANLSEANLHRANLSQAKLKGANLSRAEVGATIFGHSDLSETAGLEHVVHHDPSMISTDVFTLSKGKIPESFLRGCGLSDWEIESGKLFNPDLNSEEINRILYKLFDLRVGHALQISPLFISYSHVDGTFVDKLESRLNKKGIRFWRDVHEMKSGRMETQIDRAMRLNPTVLLILSEHSIKSDWVEHEVRTARELEKDLGRDNLCPVALDDSWKSSPWPKRVMEQIMEYNILDFSAWEDDSKFDSMFRRLIDGLELFYKG